jgi:hypothetical protein
MTAADPAAVPAPASPAALEAPPAEPFALAELRAAVVRPFRILDVVLGERARFVANVGTRTALFTLLGVLVVSSSLFAVPFAAVDGGRRLGHVAQLFLGSTPDCRGAQSFYEAVGNLIVPPAGWR